MKFLSQFKLLVRLFALAIMQYGGAPGVRAQQPALRADEFAEFVGINASPFDRYLDSGPYAGAGTKYSLELFLDLGIRHYRTGLFNDLVKPDAPQQMKAAWEKHGVQPMLLIDPHKTKAAAAVLEKIEEIDPRIIGAIEGPNEVNNKFPPQELNLRYGGRTDEAAGAAFMNDIFSALKGNPQTSEIPVVSFTAIFTDYRLARPHGAFDFGNMHSYQGYDVPSSSLLMNETRSNHLLPVGAKIRPFVPTECGYNVEEDRANGTKKTGSLRAQALNIPMLLAEYFRHGIKRTYLFALHNADGYGLLESDQSTKRPSYFALKNFLSLLKDSQWNPKTLQWEGGDGFLPRALLFSMEGSPLTVHTVTLQKKSGEYLLLIWNEVKNFDQDKKQDLFPEPVSVRLHLDAVIKDDAEIFIQNDAGDFVPQSMKLKDGGVDLKVPSSVAVLRLHLKEEGKSKPRPVSAPVNFRGTGSENTVLLSWNAAMNSEPAGYFVFRNGNHVATCLEPTYADSSEWVRPGLGYVYAVQAFDQEGNMSPRVESVVQTAAKFPDLVISRIDVPPVKAGEKVRFSAAIANAGDGATPYGVIVGATFRVDGKAVSWAGYHGAPLQPGQQVELVAGGGPNGTPDWIASAGAHVLRVNLDDVNRIPEEKSKSNNDGDRSLLVDIPTPGLLIGASDAAPFQTDLASEGKDDWIHWGLENKDGVVRKQVGRAQIGDIREIGTGSLDATPGFGMRVRWTGGSPVLSHLGTNASLWLNGVGHGYEFSAPADMTERVLKVYVGGIEGARGKMSARLSDDSAPEYVSTTWDGNAAFEWAPVPGGFNSVYTFRYRAASSGQKLVLQWVLDKEPNRFLGQIRLQAATLASP